MISGVNVRRVVAEGEGNDEGVEVLGIGSSSERYLNQY